MPPELGFAQKSGPGLVPGMRDRIALKGNVKLSNASGNGKSKETASDKLPELTCGLVMPISLLDSCTPDHWAEVKLIVTEAVDSITTPRFITRLVSDADEVGVIQKRIVQNVYNSSIVVCDVSGKNPNVMFELGLRLAFDKPTVIIKDDKTDYSFDTGVIEHIPYPRDLRFNKIVDFKRRLADKVNSTYKASIEDTNHSPFLKSFGQFHVASLAQSETTPDKVILEMLAEIQREMMMMRRRDRDRDRSRDGLGTIMNGKVPKAVLMNFLTDQILKTCHDTNITVDNFELTSRSFSKLQEDTLRTFPALEISPSDVGEALMSLQQSNARH